MILETLLLPTSMFTRMTDVSPNLPQVTGHLCFREALDGWLRVHSSITWMMTGLAAAAQHICNLYLASDLVLLVSSG